MTDSVKERSRISRLYLPGNTPAMMLNAGIHQPDGIILDLEDSVAPAKKAEARLLVRNALCQVDFYGAERMVRINQLPAGLEDLEYVVPHHVHLVLIPKCENGPQVREVDERIQSILKRANQKREIFLMPIIESCLGIENAFEIAHVPLKRWWPWPLDWRILQPTWAWRGLPEERNHFTPGAAW